MGRYDTYDDDDLDEAPQGNDGSSTIKDLRRANRAKDREISDLKEQLSTLTKGSRERSIKDVLATKGLNPKIAAFVPVDLTDEESISKWIDDYSDVFGAAPAAPEQTVSADDAAGLQAMDRTMAGGQSPIGEAAMLERIKTMPFEELEQLIAGGTAQ